jgi:hypothetical protein
MRQRPPGWQTDLATDCTVARRGLLVAPDVCFRAVCIVEGSNARLDKRKLMCVKVHPLRNKHRRGYGGFSKRQGARNRQRTVKT